MFLLLGCDHLVEPNRAREFVDAFTDCKHFIAEGENDEPKDTLADDVCKFLSHWTTTRNVSIYFPNDDHFLQKSKAQTLARLIITLFEQDKQRTKRSNL